MTKKYGITWDDKWDDLNIELACFRDGHGINDGGLGKIGHFRKAAEILWGPKSRKQFIWHPWAEKMLQEACKWQYLSVSGPGGVGKCLAPNVRVMMFDGTTKEAKDVVPGDFLMGDDSTRRLVKSTCTGRSNMVRIVPAKGESWECNDDHILTLKRAWASPKSQKRIGETVDISVKDYLKSSNSFKDQFKLYAVGVEFPEQPIEYDPQAYGIWLGNGSTGRPLIHNDDREPEVNRFIVDYFTGVGHKVAVELYNAKTCRHYMISGVVNGRRFLDFARESSPNGEKRILKRYLFNSRENRMKLLAGIIDTDGHACGSGGKEKATCFEISCSAKGLAQDIAYLARSLGFRVSSVEKMAKCGDKFFPTTRMVISGNVSEIPTLRKKCVKKWHYKDHGCVSFKIEQLGEGDWAGFTLDGNGRFLLHDFTVTHNTELFAIWAIINWMCDPVNTMVLVTSTSVTASRRRIWGSIKDYYHAAPNMPGKFVDSMGILRTDDPATGIRVSDKAGIALVAGEPSKEKESMDKIMGAHNKRVILIGDELPALSHNLVKFAMSNLASNPFFQFIGIGNPRSKYDPHGIFSTPKFGWNSINESDYEWETKYGYAIRFDSEQSPNILEGKDIYNFLPKLEDIERSQKVNGPDSLEHWSQCRGFWPPEGSDPESIYSEADIAEQNATDSDVEFIGSPIPVSACDPAKTNGGDAFKGVFGLFGMTKGGLQVLLITDVVQFNESKRDGRPYFFQIADQYKDACMKHGVRPENVAYDSTGAAGTFGQILAEKWDNSIYAVNFNGVASSMPHGAQGKPASDLFADRVTELWMTGKDFLRSGQLKGLTTDIVNDMLARRKVDKKQGMKGTMLAVESKRVMKKRVKRSPDSGDVLFLLLDLCRKRHRFRAATADLVNSVARKKWEEMMEKNEAPEREAVPVNISDFSMRDDLNGLPTRQKKRWEPDEMEEETYGFASQYIG